MCGKAMLNCTVGIFAPRDSNMGQSSLAHCGGKSRSCYLRRQSGKETSKRDPGSDVG